MTNEYRPEENLIDVSRIALPSGILELTERLAENAHDVWAIGRFNDGWTYGERRDDAAKKHPCLVPYNQLPESEKEYDRQMAMETLKAIYALGYNIEKKPSFGKNLHFFSYSTADSDIINKIRSYFEASRLDTWIAPVNIRETGEWRNQIRDGMSRCDVFLVFLSANSLNSQYVREEISWALNDFRDRFNVSNSGQAKIVPVLIDQSVAESWREEQPQLSKFQLFDLSRENSFEHNIKRLMNALGAKDPPRLLTYGKLELPIHIYVGGDGQTVYEPPKKPVSPADTADIVTNHSGKHYSLPDDYPRSLYDEIIACKKKEAEEKKRVFYNNKNLIRLKSASWGDSETYSGEKSINHPLKLELEWVEYFDVHATNFSIEKNVDPNSETKQTIQELLWTPIEEFKQESRYADPLATNLSVVTSDGYILIRTRSGVCAGNPGGREGGMPTIQPAVSATGDIDDCTMIKNPETGEVTYTYDPFKTAIRNARKEIIGNAISDDDFTVRFFGLARTGHLRFPFLFGELRLKKHTKEDIEGIHSPTHWDSPDAPYAIKFDIDSVTSWIRDEYKARPKSQPATTYFSIIQSLIYEYPDKQDDIIRKLRLD